MQFNTYIYTIACFLFLFFGTNMLFIKRGNAFLNQLLAVIMLSRGCQLVFSLLVISGQLVYVPFVVKAFNPLYFVTPACLYLYFKGFMKDERKLKKWEWLHFLPLLLAIVDMIAWYNTSLQMQQATIIELLTNKSFFVSVQIGIFPNYVNLLLRTILTTFYLFFSWKIAVKTGFINKTNKNFQSKIWILFLLITVSSIQVFTLIPFVAQFVLGYNLSNTLFQIQYASSICVLLLGMIIFILYNPRILYGYIFTSKEYSRMSNRSDNNELPIGNKIELVANKTIPDKLIPTAVLDNEQLYLEKMLDIMNTEKPFLDASFTIGALSTITNIPSHHCSYIINYTLKTSFRDWINDYRINHFISIYPTKSKSNTILSIALECGFNNRITFFNAFKKQKGLSPTDFFKE